MTSKTKIYIYNPSKRTGGTNNLLANLAKIISNNEQFDVHYIDFKNIILKIQK
jgi:hypothetical protein